MNRRHLPFIPTILLVLLAGTAAAQPYIDNCSAWTAAGVQVSVMNLPCGGGTSLTAALLYDQIPTADATITVELLDEFGYPVEDHPAEDVWIECTGGTGTFNPCPLGNIANGPSNANGHCFFTQPLAAGGHSEGADMIVAYVDGYPLVGHEMDILFNSPDIDGDGEVGPPDMLLFNEDWLGSAYRSDFDWDGIVYTSDLTILSMYMDMCECAVDGVVEVDVTPDLIGATWTLEGPDSYLFAGEEDDTLTDMAPGTYTLTWDDMSCWESPTPNPQVLELTEGGWIIFDGTYEPQGEVTIVPTPSMLNAHWELHGTAPFETIYGFGYAPPFCLPPDDYTLVWVDEPGWYHDCVNPDTQTLVNGGAITFSCLYHEYASLDIDPDPDDIDAPWQLTGPAAYDSSGMGDLPIEDLRPGQYTLTWGEVAGWYMPCTNPVIIDLVEGDYQTAACTYLERGTINVDVTPDDIGGQWALVGPDMNYGTTEDHVFTDAAPGEYTLTWEPVYCWTRPSPSIVIQTLPPGGEITFAGTYLENGTVTVDAEPNGIGITWNLSGPGGYDYDSGGDEPIDCLTPGEYTITWDPVPGWILSCPEPETMVLTPGGSLLFTCTYGEAGTVIVDPQPLSLAPSWILTGPGDYLLESFGPATIDLLPAGEYTLTWSDQDYWVEPVPNPETQTLVAEGTIVFDGLYETLPEILSIVDVDNDQGRHVRITFRRCLYDAPDGDVAGYGVYRRQDEWKGAPDVVERDAAGKLLGWDCLGTLPARQDSAYQYVAETLCDSTAAEGVCWSVFMISATTPDAGLFYDSRPDSGYSEDDLFPAQPRNLHVDYSAGGKFLAWDDNPDPDIQFYRVYTAPLVEGVCGAPAGPPAEVGVPEWVDPIAGWDVCYHVSAVDFAGNEGPLTLWSEASTTGVPDLLPSRFALRPAVPNPFNPTTTLAYELPEASSVRLSVYATDGRLVRTLVNEPNQAPGLHEVLWHGRDDAGREVAAGVYFYRLDAKGFSDTRRMVFVK